MAGTAETCGEPPTKKRRNKELPGELSRLTEDNFRNVMKFRLETDSHETGEVKVAYEASFGETIVDLTKLTLDQLRQLCKNVGVQYVNNCTKFQCRKALWILSNHQEQREKDGIPVSSAAERASSTIVRLINVIFSHNFFESFLKLNDIKKRSDHETGELPSDFWADVASALNGDSEDDDSPLSLVISPHDRHYDEMMDLDLHEFDMVTASVVRKKFNMLLKVRKVMKNNMTVSGEHDNDSYNFVDAAMKKSNCSGLTKIGCYYFFERCAAHPEVDDTFSDSMDIVLMGGTNSPLDESSLGMHSTSANTAGGSTDKKRAYAAIVDMSHVARSIAKEMKETNTLAKESNRIANQRQLIMLAQHLGKEDILEDLLTSLTSNSTSSNSGAGGVLDG